MSATVRETPGFESWMNTQLAARRRKAAAMLTGKALRKIMENTPVEDGHAHEAWLQSARHASGQLSPHGGIIKREVTSQERFASGDDKASAAGDAQADDAGKKTTVTLINRLPFVEALEKGLAIRPIDPGGPKAWSSGMKPGIKTASERVKGPLYGERIQSSGKRGVVFWRDRAGGAHFAIVRRPRAGHFAKRALDSLAAEAKRMGGKVKRTSR